MDINSIAPNVITDMYSSTQINDTDKQKSKEELTLDLTKVPDTNKVDNKDSIKGNKINIIV